MNSPLWYKILLNFSAYFPLYLILFIKFADFESFYYLIKYWKYFKWYYFFDIKGFLSILSTGLFIFSLISCVYVIYEIFRTESKKVGQYSITVKNIESRDKEVLVYLMTYVLPLISINTNNIKEVIIFILLILLIMWLSLYSDLLYINPLLTAFKRRLYEVETDKEKVIIISKYKDLHLYKGKEIICYRLDGKQILIYNPPRKEH